MIPSPLLVVTDRHGAARPLTETVRALLDGGASWVWFRDRDLEPQARHDLASDILGLVRDAGCRLTIGGDVDLAVGLGADGVHLGGSVFAEPGAASRHPEGLPGPEPGMPMLVVPQSVIASEARQSSLRRRASSIPGLLRFARNDEPEQAAGTMGSIGEAVASLRHRLGAEALVGLSAHSLADVRMAAEAGADYVTLSPILPTASKPGYGPALGLDALRAASATGIPVVALGGIGPAQARACRAAGAAGIAVMGGLMRAENPAGQTRALLDAMTSRLQAGRPW